VGALLEYATLLAMDGSAALQATAFGQMANWDALTAVASPVTGRMSRAVQAGRGAEQAERQLAAPVAGDAADLTGRGAVLVTGPQQATLRRPAPKAILSLYGS
jgi:hypothetical protein